MQKRRLNFRVGRRKRASKIVRTMLEAFENVPHKATADARVKTGLRSEYFQE